LSWWSGYEVKALMTEKSIRPGSAGEAIDMNKLTAVLRNNRVWLLLIFVLINGVTILYLRYTKNLYESSSELKLEVKNEATGLAIKNVIEEPNVNLISGEIELIQSKLFLSRVLDIANLGVSYFSTGRVLNEELFRYSPFTLTCSPEGSSARFNVPVSFEERSKTEYLLRLETGEEMRGAYGDPVSFAGFRLTLSRNDDFVRGDEIGYYFVINSKDVQLDYLLNNLTAEPLNYNANTIRLAFRDHNASKAQHVLNKIDTLYLQYSYDQKNLANRQKIEWLSNELAQIEKKMEGFEDYFENFTLENKTNNLDQDLQRMVIQINQIDSQRFQLSQRILKLTELAEGIAKEDNIPFAVSRSILPEQVNKNLEELYRIYGEQEKLRLSYHEVTFAFRERQKAFESLKQKSVQQLAELKNDAAAKLQQLNEQKRTLEARFADIPDKNTEFSKNLRFYKLNEQLYLSLMQSKSEFEVVQAGSVPDFRILSPASFPGEPISPKRMMIYAAGFVASLTIMLFFTGIMYLLNNKVTSLSELENSLSLPVLGVVPVSGNVRSEGLFVLDQPRSMVSESIRTIRTNLDFFNFATTHKVIAVSSTVSGEGKSFIASNLGAMIALSKKSVVLLDLDMRKNKSSLPVEIADTSRGMSTILINRDRWEDCVVRSAVDEFDFIPAGPHPPNPAELLLGPTFPTLLSELKKTYDYVLLDTPPVGLVADGIMAMKNADLTIYIFRANYSKKDFISNLQRIININKFSNITVVLNALPSTGAHKYGYGYYEEAEKSRSWKQVFNA
jgi:tyrosine-protein kinase Etk/Wzc